MTPTALRARRLSIGLAIAVAYYLLARVGVAMAYHGEDASLVWPAHGLAFAALLLVGPGMWPAIFAGSAASALQSAAPPVSAVLVALGTVAGLMVSTYLFRRFDFRRTLDRSRDVAALVVLGGGVSSGISAIVGVATLTARGAYAVDTAPLHAMVWWAGDLTGVLIVAPALLVWSRPPRWTRRGTRRVEFALLMLLTAAASLFAFDLATAFSARYPLAYIVFPLAIWAAVRLEQHGAVALSLIVSTIAVWQTIRGIGPFTQESEQQTLMYLQAFVTVVATSTLLLAAVIRERRILEQEQRRMIRREREARLQAQQAMSAREKAIAVVSHEVRNPLATVLLNSSSILDGPEREAMPAWVRSALHSIVLSAEHIEHVVRDLADITRLESGQIAFAPTSVESAALVSDAIHLLEPLALERRIDLLVSAEDCDVRVVVDRERILQVFSNLVGNAIRHTPHGGTVTLSAERGADEVIFSVSDTGPGIAEERIADLMLPFWETPLRLRAGHGLGIPIARAIVAAHAGRFWIDPGGDRGTSVHFSLPVATTRTAAGGLRGDNAAARITNSG